MKKFLHMSIIQDKATSCAEQVICRELNAQDLALVVGGTALDDGDGWHHDRDDWHHDRDDWHHDDDDWHHDWHHDDDDWHHKKW